MYPSQSGPDPDVERAFKWLMSFQSGDEWSARKQSIEDALQTSWQSGGSSRWDVEFFRHVCAQDRFGWYLYIIENALYEPVNSEVNENARLSPVFRRLGEDLSLLRKIGGIEQKVKHLLAPKTQPDQVLFEMLVALLWARNGYESVEFIPESPGVGKTPDIKAKKGAEEWFIETKRLTLRSGYSQREREKWAKMWEPLRQHLSDRNLSFVLDIVFHVELETLEDNFVITQIGDKLNFVVTDCVLISNEYWTVRAGCIDLKKILQHLRKYYVKIPSRQLQELIAGPWARNRSFSMDMRARIKQFGSGVTGHYLDVLTWASGVHWHCDAEEALESKARDIRGHLSTAVKQLPENSLAAVHVGIDTLDGDLVEGERFQRIVRTSTSFNPNGKQLNSIYCHLFEAYAPIDAPWYFDETIYDFHAKYADPPLPSLLGSVSPVPNDDISKGVHWALEAP